VVQRIDLQEECTAGAEHTVDLAQRTRDVSHMLEDRPGENPVEFAVRVWERLVGLEQAKRCGSESMIRAERFFQAILQPCEIVRHILAVNFSGKPSKPRGHQTFPTAKVEDARGSQGDDQTEEIRDDPWDLIKVLVEPGIRPGKPREVPILWPVRKVLENVFRPADKLPSTALDDSTKTVDRHRHSSRSRQRRCSGNSVPRREP
jgi:hypothetical protein